MVWRTLEAIHLVYEILAHSEEMDKPIDNIPFTTSLTLSKKVFSFFNLVDSPPLSPRRVLAAGLWTLSKRDPYQYPVFPWPICDCLAVHLPGTQSDLFFATLA